MLTPQQKLLIEQVKRAQTTGSLLNFKLLKPTDNDYADLSNMINLLSSIISKDEFFNKEWLGPISLLPAQVIGEASPSPKKDILIEELENKLLSFSNPYFSENYQSDHPFLNLIRDDDGFLITMRVKGLFKEEEALKVIHALGNAQSWIAATSLRADESYELISLYYQVFYLKKNIPEGPKKVATLGLLDSISTAIEKILESPIELKA